MFSLICVWINGWVNNREAGDLRRYRGHYDVIVMIHPAKMHTICALLCFVVVRYRQDVVHILHDYFTTPEQSYDWPAASEASMNDMGDTWPESNMHNNIIKTKAHKYTTAGVFLLWDTLYIFLDCFTLPLHSPNGRYLPAVRLCKGTISGVWKNGGNSHWSHEPITTQNSMQSRCP